MQIKPLNTKILVEEVQQEEVRASGIILAPDAKGKDTKQGKVVSVGEEVSVVSINDLVYVDWTKGVAIKVNGKLMAFFDVDQLLAVVR